MSGVAAPQQKDADRSIAILIVEDDFLVRWQAAEYLRSRDYRVVEASNVSDAMAVLASGTRVDIVFSDVNLQGDLTGHALERWLSQHHAHVPLLLTSGDDGARHSIAIGATRAFVRKPYVLADVDLRLKEMLAHLG